MLASFQRVRTQQGQLPTEIYKTFACLKPDLVSAFTRDTAFFYTLVKLPKAIECEVLEIHLFCKLLADADEIGDMINRIHLSDVGWVNIPETTIAKPFGCQRSVIACVKKLTSEVFREWNLLP